MFIDFKDIKHTDVTIDVRTKQEFENMTLLSYNVSIIDEEDYKLLKKHIYLAIPIILKGLFKKKREIAEQLHELSHYRRYRLIIGCSQGRLRSPIMYLYARYLGIDAKILKGGIKPFFIKKDYNIRNLYGF